MTHPDHTAGRAPSSAQDALRATAADLAAEMNRHAPLGSRPSSGAVQSWHRISGRFAEGRVSDLSVQQGQATSARYLLADGLRHRTVSGLDPRAARWGEKPAANRRDMLPDPPVWQEIPAVLRTLRALEDQARGHDPRIAQVVVDFELSEQDLCLVAGEGLGMLLEEQRLLSYLSVRVIARQGDRVSTGFYTPGTSGPLGGLDARACGSEVARRAVAGLEARPAPVGRMPVVVAGGRGMVLLHEACCHPLEGDEVVNGSVYAGRLGEQIASPLVTVRDDATVTGAVGSYRYDDEGVVGGSTGVIEDGRLVGYLTDQESAARLGTASSGNGRCTTVLQPPLPRMTNTCLAAGTSSVADIIADTPYGIYAEHVGGGEVVEATGEFTFRVTNGWLIENGRITDPIEETTIAGLGTEVLRDIDAVADDVTVGAAKCGKFGQWVPVGVIGPTLRVGSLLVGGTQR
ncbi:TldD/PmbA family protein [Streptomyces virginiae]|uniref:TldD/PmbA family protein n=1 Tax=Streptomyces virginiae TaxID=1961 RepID=UPI00224ED3D5|nr:TldD/PmbA family protein [Streptomyces virginiae]MCX5275682.1 TldD/PmbA family protein [Streptomyces virginiae]